MSDYFEFNPFEKVDEKSKRKLERLRKRDAKRLERQTKKEEKQKQDDSNSNQIKQKKEQRNLKVVKFLVSLAALSVVGFFIFAIVYPDSKPSEDIVDKEEINRLLDFTITDKMALTYIQSRAGNTKWADEDGEIYMVYIKLQVYNKSDDIVSFGSSSSDFYVKLDIGRASNQPVYFQENKHLHDRIPYWTDAGYDDPNWDKIVFFYADESLTYIQPKQTKTFYLAFQAETKNADYNLNLVFYKNSDKLFGKDSSVKTMNVGVVEILE